MLIELPIFVAVPLLGFLYRLTDELAVGGGGLLLGLGSGILAGYLITESSPAALMVGGVLLALLFADRLKTSAHRIGLGATILIVLWKGPHIVEPGHIIILTLAALGDRQLGKMKEPYSTFADTNIVLNIFLLSYVALGILTLNSIVVFVLAELTYFLGGILLGSKKRERYPAGIGP